MSAQLRYHRFSAIEPLNSFFLKYIGQVRCRRPRRDSVAMITAAPTVANCTRPQYLERCSQDTLTLTRYILQLLPLSFPGTVFLSHRKVKIVLRLRCVVGCVAAVARCTTQQRVGVYWIGEQLGECKICFSLLPADTLILLDQEAKGIASIYEWQEKCLDEFLACTNKRLVYSLPTGAGKSLVAEVCVKRENVCPCLPRSLETFGYHALRLRLCSTLYRQVSALSRASVGRFFMLMPLFQSTMP